MAHTGLELTVDEGHVASSTREERAGPYTVMVTTAIPELGLRIPRTGDRSGSENVSSADQPSAGKSRIALLVKQPTTHSTP